MWKERKSKGKVMKEERFKRNKGWVRKRRRQDTKTIKKDLEGE